MNITSVPQRIELAVWVTIIPLLKTSTLAGKMVRSGYRMVETYRRYPYALQMVGWAIGGLTIGFLVGLLFLS